MKAAAWRLRELKYFTWPAVLLAAGLLFSCAKEAVKQPVPDVRTPDKIDAFCPEFEREGFISGDLYRIIIVVPKEGRAPDESAMKKTAKLRALSSLQKFLVSQNRIVDQNTTAEILSLVENRGKLINTNCKTESRDIFYYDITREHLREYILGMSKKR